MSCVYCEPKSRMTMRVAVHAEARIISRPRGRTALRSRGIVTRSCSARRSLLPARAAALRRRCGRRAASPAAAAPLFPARDRLDAPVPAAPSRARWPPTARASSWPRGDGTAARGLDARPTARRSGASTGRAGRRWPRAAACSALREADGTVWGIDPATRLGALEGRVRRSPGTLPPVVDGDARRWSPARASRVLDAAQRARALVGARRAARSPRSRVAAGPLRARGRGGRHAALPRRGHRAPRSGPTRPAASAAGARPSPTTRAALLLGHHRPRASSPCDAKDGTAQWRWKVGARRAAPPARRGRAQRASFATHEAVLYALRRGSGNLAWRAALPSRPLGGPAALRRRRCSSRATACGRPRTCSSASTARTGRRLGDLRTPAEMRTPPLLAGGLARRRCALRDRAGRPGSLPPAAALPAALAPSRPNP